MNKEWLIRRAKKYYLGPFDRDTVQKMILDADLGAYDEISKSGNSWMYLKDCPPFMQWVEKMAPHGSEERTIKLTDEEITRVTSPGGFPLKPQAKDKIIDLKPKAVHRPETQRWHWPSSRFVGGVGALLAVVLSVVIWFRNMPQKGPADSSVEDFPTSDLPVVDPKLKELSETFQQYHVYLYQGELEEKAGNLQAAMALYRKAIQSKASDLKAQIRLTALQLHLEKDFEKVRLDFLKILSEQDIQTIEVCEINNYLGLIELQKEKYAAARIYFERAIQKQAGFAPAHFNLGYAYFFLKQYYNARRHFDQAVELQPNMPSIYLYLGRTLQKLDKNVEAIREYENANRINPNLHLPYLYLSLLYFNLGNPPQSFQYLNQMLPLDPDYTRHIYQDAKYYQEPLSYDFILKTYAIILKEKKQDAGVVSGLGLLYFLSGQKQEGINLVKKSLKLNDQDAVTHTIYGYMLQQMGDLEGAMQHLKTALRHEYQNSLTHVLLSEIYIRLGQYQEAVEHCRKVFSYDPYYVRAYEVLGRSLVQLDRVSEAVKAFTKALEYDPNYMPAKKMLLMYSQ